MDRTTNRILIAQYERLLPAIWSLAAVTIGLWMSLGVCCVQVFTTNDLNFENLGLPLFCICFYLFGFLYCVRYYNRPYFRDPLRWLRTILFGQFVRLFGQGPEPQRFTRFSDLPPELRRLIWQHACPDPRVVEVVRIHGSIEWCCPKESQGRPSPLLFINKEARFEFLLYNWPFLTQIRTLGINPVALPRVSYNPTRPNPITYFNPMRDTLFISSKMSNTECNLDGFDADLDLGLRASPVLRHLRFIAITLREIDAVFYLQGHFRSAESIKVVQNDLFNSVARREAGEVVLHNAPPTVCRESEMSVSDKVQLRFVGIIHTPWELMEVSRGGNYTSMVDDVAFGG